MHMFALIIDVRLIASLKSDDDGVNQQTISRRNSTNEETNDLEDLQRNIKMPYDLTKRQY